MSGGFDLVIVGCGPVGAYAANLFGRAGLKTLVLEREQSPYSLPRAIHVDHEVMRLLADVELLEPLADRLRAADGHLHIGADRGVIRQLTSAGAPQAFRVCQRLLLLPARTGRGAPHRSASLSQCHPPSRCRGSGTRAAF